MARKANTTTTTTDEQVPTELLPADVEALFDQELAESMRRSDPEAYIEAALGRPEGWVMAQSQVGRLMA